MNQGQYGIQSEVFLSLPCVLGSQGVTNLVKLSLNEKEIDQLVKSAEALNNVQSRIKF